MTTERTPTVPKYELTNEPDPVPPEWREAEPERDLARELEPQIDVELHVEYEDGEPDDDGQSRMHYLSFPPGYEPAGQHEVHVSGFVFHAHGAWWWRPSTWGPGERPATYASAPFLPSRRVTSRPRTRPRIGRRRVAWELAA